MKQQAPRELRPDASAGAHAVPAPGRAAFTLTELLIVVAIIAVLASLITAAAINARNAARRAAISAEISQIGDQFTNFRSALNVYPPNAMNAGDSNLQALVNADFRRAFKRMFPRHQEPPGLIDGLCGTLGSGNPRELVNGMQPDEALFFWLGGFSDDVKFPISGPGGPSFHVDNGEVLENRNLRHEFDLTQLGPRDNAGLFHDVDNGGDGRYIVYPNPLGTGNRRINFWRYKPAGSEQPLIYFDTSRHRPVDYDLPAAMNDVDAAVNVFAIKKLREGISLSANPGIDQLVYVNEGSFQVLHSGIDDAWGDWTAMSVVGKSAASEVQLFPIGPFLGEAADSLTSFTSSTLEDAQQ